MSLDPSRIHSIQKAKPRWGSPMVCFKYGDATVYAELPEGVDIAEMSTPEVVQLICDHWSAEVGPLLNAIIPPPQPKPRLPRTGSPW